MHKFWMIIQKTQLLIKIIFYQLFKNRAFLVRLLIILIIVVAIILIIVHNTMKIVAEMVHLPIFIKMNLDLHLISLFNLLKILHLKISRICLRLKLIIRVLLEISKHCNVCKKK